MKLVDAADRERAVTDLDTNLVVTAGAGTGKTSLMVERVLHLIVEAGVPLTELAVITFTEKAAAELRDRLEDGLERILEIETTRRATRDESQEADRVHARLDSAARKLAAKRARRALDDLNRATVSTIHSLAGNLLRRNHRAAGVDVHFEVDADEMASREVFRELWAGFLESSLGGEEVSPAWRTILERLGMDELETIAYELCRFGCGEDVVEESARRAQLAYAESCARGLLRELERIRLEIAGADRLNPNFVHSLDTLDRVLRQAAEEHALPASREISTLVKKPTPGEHSGVRDVDGVKNALSAVRERALRLARSDPGVPADLGALLRDVSREFRAEYLRRGWVSYDALIHLSRNLLRDNLEVRRMESRRFRQLLVDEFQDTDPLQYEIVFFLACDPDATSQSRDAFRVDLRPGKLFIVGDAKQSIYRFRGADIDAYLAAVAAVERDGGQVLTLRANFRSRPDVIEPLNRLFASHFTPDEPSRSGVRDPAFDALSATRRRSSSPHSIEVWSVGEGRSRAAERRQAEASALAAWLDRERRRGALAAKDVAVLFRALTEVDVYLRALRRFQIPYLVEGGRGFYQRYEVELLLAALRMVRNPADAVALVSCLRSPLGAVPDTELQLYAEDGRAGSSLWSLDANPDATRFPELARALRTFGEFADRHRHAGIDRLAQAALEELPLRLAMSASYEGAQRVANLEKAVLHIVSLARDGRWSPEEILTRIEREDAAEKQEADSPLADESVDAVRVLSIHKSKGLEWPVVIIPDLSREQGARGGSSIDVGVTREAGLPRALALKSRQVETPARVWQGEVDKAQERAEAKRLFYVATTRAKDRLVLLVGGSKDALDGKCEWIEAMRAWGYHADAAFTAGDGAREPLCGGILHRRVIAYDLPVGGSREQGLDATLIAAGAAYASFGQAGSKERRGLEAPSQSHASSRSRRVEAAAGDTEDQGPVARAAGTAVHLLLEAWDGRDAEWLREQAPRAVAVAVGHERVDSARVLEVVNGIVETAVGSGQLDQLKRIEVLGREVPLLYRDDEGRLWDGAIDLVARRHAGEGPTVMDYKTDHGDSAAQIEERHRGQLDVYARGLKSAMDLEELPPRHVVWLRKK